FIQTVLETKKLRWFQSSATGTDRALLKTFGRQAEIYTNAHGQAVAIAEYVLWQTLDFLRAGPERRANAEARAWRRLSARELSGLNWLIFGFGEIGRETAKRVRLLGGYVVGVRRTPGPDPDADQIIGPGGLHAALPAADVVLLCAPLTSETQNIADAAFFSNMREDALLINVGRGALVVESDLIAALDAGRPAFAALDVVAQEPAAPDNPLWAHPKINLTAHDSPATPGSKQRNDQTFLDNLKRYLDGEPLQNIVPKSDFE
ncbi:MAG: NAD(P)-dependent oxidoreductase, partial [Pseudomonadota bacterium]